MPTKVLVFESDPAFAGELRTELGQLGCSTTVVDDGNVGLQQAAADKPDLILLSIELPRMNGFSVCNKLKKDPNLKEVPLIIMSSESSDETFEQHKKLRTRAEDYVHKPIAFGELLRHIQELVTIAATPSDAEGVIVIDDEIEVGSSDYLLDDDATEVAAGPVLVPSRRLDTVDADVDAFAESAFGRLTGPDASSSVETRAGRNGTTPPEPVVQPAARKPAAATPSRAASARPPPAGIEPAEYERVREEVKRAKDRLDATERTLEDTRQEIGKLRLEAGEAERLTRELEELKVKLASGAKIGAVSSREFLDLREALNKKDKEILALKEQLSKKDKDIYEARDRTLALEHGRADLDERLLVLEREIADLKDRNEALAADKDLAKKASDDFRVRFEKARLDADTRERQLTELRARHAEEIAAIEDRLGSVRAELDQTLANERAEHARALDEAEQRRKAESLQARRDQETALNEARDIADRDRREALSTHAAQLRQEHDGKMAALHRAHLQEMDRSRDQTAELTKDVAARHESELAALRKESDERLTQAQTEAEQHTQAALEAVRSDHAEKIVTLENDRDSRIAALEARASRELGEAHDKLAKSEVDISGVRGELGSLRESKETGDAVNEARIADLEKRHGDLQGEVASLRKELGEAKDKLAGESSRADRAYAKWQADRQSLERAKDALAVALAHVEEPEGRPIG